MTTNSSIYKKVIQRGFRGSEEFGNYKSKISKLRHKRALKRGAKNILKRRYLIR